MLTKNYREETHKVAVGIGHLRFGIWQNDKDPILYRVEGEDGDFTCKELLDFLKEKVGEQEVRENNKVAGRENLLVLLTSLGFVKQEF